MSIQTIPNLDSNDGTVRGLFLRALATEEQELEASHKELTEIVEQVKAHTDMVERHKNALECLGIDRTEIELTADL